MRIKISVTANDISNGSPRLPASCPVALAVKNRIKEGYYASVGRHDMTIKSAQAYSVGWPKELSRRVKRFIIRFDSMLSVEPFKFFVDIDKSLLRSSDEN